jgi:perosamine synthetase
LPNHITKYAHDAIDSTWISSNGKYINLVSELIKSKFGYKHVLLTNNGTTAGHLMSIGLNKKYNQKKIVVPNNVYISAWNMLKVNPIYEFDIIDSNMKTWCGNYNEYLIKHPENNIILIVHNINSIVNVPNLKEKYPNNIFIEDNCEGFLGKYNNKYTGSESEFSTLSFFGNKNITSGEGGALITNNGDDYSYLDSVRCQGNTNDKFIFDKLGYNYRMTNIEAALLYGQLLFLDEIIELKQIVFDIYNEIFKDVDWIEIQKTDINTTQPNWMFGVKFSGNQLQKIKQRLFENGVENRSMFPPINYHKHYNNLECVTTNAKNIHESCLILPSYPELTKQEIYKICDIILK